MLQGRPNTLRRDVDVEFSNEDETMFATNNKVAPQTMTPQPSVAPPHLSVAPSAPDLQKVILSAPSLFIKQKKKWLEIFTNLEATNKYTVLTEQNQEAGSIVEKGNGFLGFIKRMLLRTHRPFELHVKDARDQVQLIFTRKFFFFFSDIEVYAPNGIKLGSAHRRFSFFFKKYDLKGNDGQTFATINTFMLKIWTFTVYDMQNQEVAKISKKWGGVMREGFTNADTFMMDFGKKQWKAHERAVLFATAMSIDMDFFEAKKGGLMKLIG